MKKFIGWLFLTKAYLAALSDEELMRRARLKRTRHGYVIERSCRAFERARVALDKLAKKGLAQ